MCIIGFSSLIIGFQLATKLQLRYTLSVFVYMYFTTMIKSITVGAVILDTTSKTYTSYAQQARTPSAHRHHLLHIYHCI